MEERLKHIADIVKKFYKREKIINKTNVIAKETAEGVKDIARKESKLIIKEAEKNADRIVDEALSKSRHISMETEDLHRQAKVFRTRLKMLIEAQLDMINNQDWDEFLSIDELVKVEVEEADEQESETQENEQEENDNS